MTDRNSFGLSARAEFFCAVKSIDEACEALDFAHRKNLQVRVLGSGSNLLLPPLVEGLVLSPAMQGVQVTGMSVDVAAGMNWHEFVQSTLTLGLYGLENLALIPGQVGAAPIQNIGAYGVELSERVSWLQAVNLQSSELVTFSSEECQFGYRDSIFKSNQQDQWLITQVRFHLDSEFTPRLDYQGVREGLKTGQPSAQEVFDVVCQIRRSKLPDPDVVGNVGSFFKNPVISNNAARMLKQQFEHLPIYPQSNNQVKLSAAFLIDQLGFKGQSQGGASVSMQHALVLQNDGLASYDDVQVLASSIGEAVKRAFDIDLEIEPRFLG